MTPGDPSADDDATVPLTEAEQDEINNRIVSGDAAQESSGEGVELARLGSYVVLEVDEDQRIEKHSDEQTAEQRYDELKTDHVDSGDG